MTVIPQGFKPRAQVTRAFSKPVIVSYGTIKQPEQMIVHKVVRTRSSAEAK